MPRRRVLGNSRTVSNLDSAPGSGVILPHPCQRQGGAKGFCGGSTRCLRAKARKADRAAKRSAAVSKATLAIQDCSNVAHGGFGALGGGWGSPQLLCFNLLTRPVIGNRVSKDPRCTLGDRFVLFSGLANFGGGLPIMGLDRRAFCTFPGNKAVALASSSAPLQA